MARFEVTVCVSLEEIMTDGITLDELQNLVDAVGSEDEKDHPVETLQQCWPHIGYLKKLERTRKAATQRKRKQRERARVAQELLKTNKNMSTLDLPSDLVPLTRETVREYQKQIDNLRTESDSLREQNRLMADEVREQEVHHERVQRHVKELQEEIENLQTLNHQQQEALYQVSQEPMYNDYVLRCLDRLLQSIYETCRARESSPHFCDRFTQDLSFSHAIYSPTSITESSQTTPAPTVFDTNLVPYVTQYDDYSKLAETRPDLVQKMVYVTSMLQTTLVESFQKQIEDTPDAADEEQSQNAMESLSRQVANMWKYGRSWFGTHTTDAPDAQESTGSTDSNDLQIV